MAPTTPTTLRRHEIPTHLNAEDRAFYGLTARQLMWLTVGCAGGYGLWTQWPGLPVGPRLALAAVCVALAAALALVRPHRRGLEEWAFAALHYTAVPKRSAWHPREPEFAAWRPSGHRWAEHAPHLSWRPAPEAGEREEPPR